MLLSKSQFQFLALFGISCLFQHIELISFLTAIVTVQ